MWQRSEDFGFDQEWPPSGDDEGFFGYDLSPIVERKARCENLVKECPRSVRVRFKAPNEKTNIALRDSIKSIAYDAWLAQKPFENPNADPHPFVPKLYEARFVQDARLANADAGRNDAEAKRTGNVAAQYLSNTVLLAAVLFFAGASAKFDQRYVRQSSFFFAVAAFLFAAVRMLILPVTNLIPL